MRRNKGLSLIEILVISFVIIVLAVIIVPIMSRYCEYKYECRHQLTCPNNQRQLAASLLMYAQDHDNKFPLTTTIWGDIKADSDILICPTTGKRLPNAYLYNKKLSGLNYDEIYDPAKIFATVDGETIYNSNTYYSKADVQYRHFDSAIASFIDGHVESFKKNDAKLPWDLPVKMVEEEPAVKPMVKKKSKRNK